MYFIYSETEQDWCAEFNVIFTAAENPNTDGGGGGITLNISRNFAGHSLRRGVKKNNSLNSARFSSAIVALKNATLQFGSWCKR